MTADTAVRFWKELQETSPHGCRVHITGGEVFGNWELLVEILTRARSEGLTPPDKVETNAFWATDDQIVRKRIEALDAAGMRKLGISADSFHQQFVPIENLHRLARIATEMLGTDRMQIRWKDFLDNPSDFDFCVPARGQNFCKEALASWISEKHERLTGRAGEVLAPHLPLHPVESFAGKNCREGLMRSRHVHISPQGYVFPGVCAGIVLGNAAEMSIADIREKVKDDYSGRAVLGSLVRGGPVELLDVAKSFGFESQTGYASKCHLCWKIRKYLRSERLFSDEIAPAWMYENATFQT